MPYDDPEFIKITEEEFLERRKKKLPDGPAVPVRTFGLGEVLYEHSPHRIS